MPQTSSPPPPSASPPSTPKPARRIVPAQPNLRLDPHGLSGTQTARRVRNARRKRQLQTIWVSALTGVAVVGAATFLGAQLLGFSPTQATLATQTLARLPFGASGPAALARDGALYVQSSEGALWKVSARGSATKLHTATFPARPAPLLTKNRVVLGTQDGQITVLNGANGSKIWSRDLGAPISAQPLTVAFPGGKTALLCASDSGKIAAFDFQNGQPLWNRELGVPVGEGLALAQNRVLIPTLAGQNSRGGLVALDARSGNFAWRFPGQTKSSGAGICTPLFDAQTNRVFWANDEGAVLALDARSGARIWKSFAASESGGKAQPVVLRGCPALLGGTLVVGGEDGVLRAFNAKNGEALWATTLGAPLQGPVQTAGDLAIFARTGGGEAFVVGLASGEILKRAPFSASGVWRGEGGFDLTADGQLVKIG